VVPPSVLRGHSLVPLEVVAANEAKLHKSATQEVMNKELLPGTKKEF
jgi:hypothetical protein